MCNFVRETSLFGWQFVFFNKKSDKFVWLCLSIIFKQKQIFNQISCTLFAMSLSNVLCTNIYELWSEVMLIFIYFTKQEQQLKVAIVALPHFYHFSVGAQSSHIILMSIESGTLFIIFSVPCSFFFHWLGLDSQRASGIVVNFVHICPQLIKSKEFDKNKRIKCKKETTISWHVVEVLNGAYTQTHAQLESKTISSISQAF